MKNKKLIIGMAIGLAILIAAFATTFFIQEGKRNEKLNDTGSSVSDNADANEQESKMSISVTIVYKDKTQKIFDIKTNEKYLSDALFQEGLVTKEEHNGSGMYTVIDGVKADYSVDQSWWCVTKDGAMTNYGMDDLILSNGDKYEITYTIS